MHFDCEYYNLPPRELQQAIDWLRGMAGDAEAKAARLETLLKYKERQQRYMRNLNDLADEFDIDDKKPHDKKIDAIVQRLGCEYHRAEQVLDLLKKRIKKRRIKRRDAEIIDNYLKGMDHTKNARLTGVTRQTVHSVLTAEKSRKLL